MANTISPNMGLIVPGVGTEPGPTWATDLNSDLGILDQHNHSNGQGVAVTPAGLNINADLTMNGNNLIDVNTVRFLSLPSSLPGTSPNLGCVYVAGNELYYNDESGNVVAITKTGSVNAGAGSITGLPSGTASATYSSGSETFVWQSATLTPANMDGGSFIFRNITANSNGVTVEAPASLAASYNIVWPLLPGSTSNVTIDASGNMGTQSDDQVGEGMTSVGANAVANSRTRTVASTVGVGGVAISSSSGGFFTTSASPVAVTNLSVTITTSGRPVQVSLVSVPNGSTGIEAISSTSGYIYIVQGSNTWQFIFGASVVSQTQTPSGGFAALDTTVSGAPGTYTYTVNANTNGGGTLAVQYVQLVAYEI